MRLITVEEHFTAQEIIDENNKFSDTSEFYKYGVCWRSIA